VFKVLEMREVRLQSGKTEQKGAALIRAAGCGKSRTATEVISEYYALAEASGDRDFDHRIVSIVVTGRASVGETLKAIIANLMGEHINANRKDDYLTDLLINYMTEVKIAAIHLDEAQDVGRFKTSDSTQAFAKRFRNLTQAISLARVFDHDRDP
jgi:hypothetical protein